MVGRLSQDITTAKILTVVSSFEAVGQFSAGKIDETELMAVETSSLPWCWFLRRDVYRQYHVIRDRSDGL